MSEVRTLGQGAVRDCWVKMQFAGHNESRTRRLGRPKMHGVHHASPTAKHRVQVQTAPDKSFLTVLRHRLHSHGYKTVLQDYALLFSLHVTSLESVPDRPRFLGVTPVDPNDPRV